MFGIVANSVVSQTTPQYATIQYVGGRSDSVSSNAVSLTGLSGGLATQPSLGDLVIVVFGRGTTGTTSNLSVTGYTQVANLSSTTGTSDNLYFYVGYKYLTALDTTLTLVNSAITDSAVSIHVWRNVSSTNPLDVTSTTSISDSSRPIAPSITPVTSGAIILSAVGIGSDIAGATWTNSQLSNVISAPDDSTTNQECHVGIGSTAWTSAGAFSVPAWTSSDTDSTYAGAAVTMALRPALL